MTRFSDSYILYTDDATADDLWILVQAVASLLAAQAMLGLLARGSIVRGEMYVHRKLSVYLGEALVRASEIERNQEWAGAVLDSSGIESEEELECLRELEKRGWLMSYDVPMKSGRTSRQLAIGWPFLASALDSMRKRVEQVCPADDERAKAKQQATWEYVSEHQRRHTKKPWPDRSEMDQATLARLEAAEAAIEDERQRHEPEMRALGITPVEHYFLVLNKDDAD